MTTKLTQNQISELKENIENESCSTILVDPKLVFEPYPYPNTSSIGPQKKLKMTPKLSPNQISELKEI